MKRSILSVVLLFAFLFSVQTDVVSQAKKPRASLNASVTQIVGVETTVTFTYSRPNVKGRTVWGELVPFGLAPGNRYSDEKPFPWRAGANENTTVEFSKDVKVDGHALAAGKYGIHMIPDASGTWVLMFSKDNANWGSFQYNKDNDALRLNVKTASAPHAESLTYGFDNLSGTEVTAYMHWEKVKVPFTISTVN